MVIYERYLKDLAIDAMKNCVVFASQGEMELAHQYRGRAIAYEMFLEDDGINLEAESKSYRLMIEKYEKAKEQAPKFATSAGEITTRFYDDGIARGTQVLLGDDIVCVLDVYEASEGEEEGEARVLAYKVGDDEPTECTSVNR